MSEEKVQAQAQEQEEKNQQERINLRVELPDIITETYAKAYLAYRISLENWFLLNEILAFIQNQKLTSKEIQNRLQKLFSVANTEIVKELVKLNQVALAKAKAAEATEESEEADEGSE
jgi:surface polysaccharide O-acyltransferase-like enzyme